MELRWTVEFVTFVAFLAHTFAIPTSLVEQMKASELRDTNKVKRAHNAEDGSRDVPYFNGNNNNPSAIKRGMGNLKNSADQQAISEWAQERALYQQNAPNLADIQSTLYNNGDNPFDDKTVAEYEKGFRYGTNKEKLDEALENAVLKSELYGDQAAVNQYRYYGNEDRRRRRRRDVHKFRLSANRIKREADLTPEEILTILTLYENDRRHQNRPSSESSWNFENNINPSIDDNDDDDNNQVDQEENWFDAPVYPHRGNSVGPSYMYEDKRGRWGGYSDRKKRFMVAKKRNDPTKELRYLNGPNKNDYYTLSQLLNYQQRADNNVVPLYHRLIL